MLLSLQLSVPRPFQGSRNFLRFHCIREVPSVPVFLQALFWREVFGSVIPRIFDKRRRDIMSWNALALLCSFPAVWPHTHPVHTRDSTLRGTIPSALFIPALLGGSAFFRDRILPHCVNFGKRQGLTFSTVEMTTPRSERTTEKEKCVVPEL